jgi:hypothetical protein
VLKQKCYIAHDGNSDGDSNEYNYGKDDDNGKDNNGGDGGIPA